MLEKDALSRRKLIKGGASTLMAGSAIFAATGSAQADHDEDFGDRWGLEVDVVKRCINDAGERKAHVALSVDTPFNTIAQDALTGIFGYGVGRVASSGVAAVSGFLASQFSRDSASEAAFVVKERADENETLIAINPTDVFFGWYEAAWYIGTIDGNVLDADENYQSCDQPLLPASLFLA